MAHRTFIRGSSVFTCTLCDRRTRLTDQGNDTLCPQCWELAGIDNSVNDGYQTWEEVRVECEALLAHIGSHGGNVASAKAGFDFLFIAEEKAASFPEILAAAVASAPAPAAAAGQVEWVATVKDGSTVAFPAPADRKLAKEAFRALGRGGYTSLRRVK